MLESTFSVVELFVSVAAVWTTSLRWTPTLSNRARGLG